MKKFLRATLAVGIGYLIGFLHAAYKFGVEPEDEWGYEQ